MAEDNSSDDQLDEFIHSYSRSDDDGRAQSSDDEDDASYSDSTSEPPEDGSAEEEDVALYDLYDNSARQSPHPPASPTLQDTRRELDPVFGDGEDTKIHYTERRKRAYGLRPSFGPSSHKAGEIKSAPDGGSSESGIETSDEEHSRE